MEKAEGFDPLIRRFDPYCPNSYLLFCFNKNMILTKKLWICKNFTSFLKKVIPKLVKQTLIKNNEIIIKTTRSKLNPLLDFLKNHLLCGYSLLIDIAAYDLPSNRLRFPVVYNLLSERFNSRLFVYVYANEVLKLDTAVSIHKAANWFEREIWDLYGIFFYKHPDLRRILTDYGFNYHPLRKDFPLTGYKEVYYSDNDKRIIYTSVETLQNYRVFSFKNPWTINK